MDHGSSPADFVRILERLDRLEAKSAEQARTIIEQQMLIAEQARTIAEQQAIITEQRTMIASLREALETAREQITLLKKALFAPKRERFVSSPDPKLLFDAVMTEPAPSPSSSESSPSPPKPPRKQRRKFVFPDFLPVVRHEHKLNDDECSCGCCGEQRTIIDTSVTKQIEIERAKAYVEEHVRYTYACSKCRDGKQMVTTTKPPKPLEKSPFGASVLAWIIDAKFNRHLPTYRHQEMLLEPLGMWLSRPLIANLLRGSADVLRPLTRLALEELLKSYVIQADETPVKYLGDERGKASQGFLFGYAGDAEHRFVFYDYRASRSRAGPAEILADYRGVLLTDGFGGYEALVRESNERLRAAACWMHARREFDEARATKSHPLVEATIARIRLLYDVEDRAKHLPHDDRRALRERESRPLVDGIFAAMKGAEGPRPTTKLAQAVMGRS